MDTQKLTRPINVDKRAVIKTDHEAYFQEASSIKGQLKSKMVSGSLKDTTISTLICPWTLSLKSLYSSSISDDGMSVAKDQSEATGAQVGSCTSGPCRSRWGSRFHNVVTHIAVGVWNNFNIPLLIYQYSPLALHQMIFHKKIFLANIRKTASRGSNKF